MKIRRPLRWKSPPVTVNSRMPNRADSPSRMPSATTVTVATYKYGSSGVQGRGLSTGIDTLSVRSPG